MSLNRPLESIQESDLQALLDNQVPEGKSLEYKQILPAASDSDRKEFLADASSFANAAGGHLIYGIAESSGVPTELCGLDASDPDAEIRRLESMIQDGIAPRIPGISTRAIALVTSRIVIVIQIPRSFASPHMVTFKGYSRFYSRNSAGKYPLDVTELRTAFALSETTSERIRDFRLERLARVVSGETPAPLKEGAKIVLHVIPLSAFEPGTKFDLHSIGSNPIRVEPMYTTSWGHRFNFDGVLSYSASPQSPFSHSYLQVFRNGIIEAVEARLLEDRDGERVIPSIAYEKELLKALPRFLSIQKELRVDPPLFIMLTLAGVKGYTMAVDRFPFLMESSHPIDRDTLQVPEVMIERFDIDPAEVMRPAFDAVWNATGFPRSMNYDEGGKWVVH
jgi:hypothetical protein